MFSVRPIIVLYLLCLATSIQVGRAEQVKHTFYGYPDNDPPGPDINYDCGRGHKAGGIGTYDDPLTFASAYGFQKCEVIYDTYLQKYLRHEDSCQGCTQAHIDVWIGDASINGHNDQLECENRLTPGSQNEIIRKPASNLQVDKTALYKPGGKCELGHVYADGKVQQSGAQPSEAHKSGSQTLESPKNGTQVTGNSESEHQSSENLDDESQDSEDSEDSEDSDDGAQDSEDSEDSDDTCQDSEDSEGSEDGSQDSENPDDGTQAPEDPNDGTQDSEDPEGGIGDFDNPKNQTQTPKGPTKGIKEEDDSYDGDEETREPQYGIWGPRRFGRGRGRARYYYP